MGQIRNIQGLRAIAALLVVASHAYRVEEKFCQGAAYLSSLVYGIYGVDLFFIISGLVMVLVTLQSSYKQISAARFLSKRMIRIFPLYWFYTSLVLIVFLIKPAWVNSSQGGHVNILKSYLLLPELSLPLLMVGWSLIFEMYFYYVYSGLIYIGLQKISRMLAIWASVVLLGNLYYFHLNPDLSSALLNYTLNPMVLEFIMGAVIGLFIVNGKTHYGWHALALGGFWLLLTAMGVIDYSMLQLHKDWPRVLYYGAPFAFVVYGLTAIEIKESRTFPVWLSRLGDASYTMYLSHVLVLSVIGRLWATHWGQAVPHALMLVVMFAAVILFSLVGYRYIEQPLLRFSRLKLKALFGRSHRGQLVHS